MKFSEALKIPSPYLLLIAAVALLLAAFPQIDLAVSGFFYDPATKQFPLGESELAKFVTRYFYSFKLPVLFLALCGVVVVFTFLFKRRYFAPSLRLAAYFTLVFMVVPVLAVSTGLKEHWGRARPYDIVQFGGEKQFTPYYQPSDQCVSDCSFSSGHSVRAFYFFTIYFAAVALGLSGWRKRALFSFVLSYGVLAMVLRIIEGNHYVSDVLTSAILVTYAAWALCRWMEVEKAKDDLLSSDSQ